MSEVKVSQIVALNDCVLVLPDETPNEQSGMVLPENAKEKPQTGVVVTAGPDCRNVGVGDAIMFGKYAGLEMEFEKKKFLIMREADIFAKLNLS